MRDLQWGDEQSFLDGAVEVTRVPPTSQLTTPTTMRIFQL